MRCAGIVAEYNPFHNGHRYHIESSKKLTGCDFVIAVMSGNFVQRGEPAMFDKMLRTRWALLGGADVVLQLPAVFSLSSAERFANGSISILEGTGVLDFLCFGSEVTDTCILRKAVVITDLESCEMKKELSAQLQLGRSFPRARHNALVKANIQKEVVHALSLPNSTLGVEYIRALDRIGSNVKPVTVPRIQAMHDSSELNGSIASASAIRRGLYDRDAAFIKDFIPEPVYHDMEVLKNSGLLPIAQNSFSDIILFALRSMSKEELRSLPDVSEGFENVLFESSRACSNYEKFLNSVKSKRYTLARIRRICMCAMLRITRELQREALNCEDSLYLRVLGIRSGARELLSEIGKKAKLPMIVRASDLEKLSPSAMRLFQNDLFCDEIYAIGLGVPAVSDFASRLLVL